MARRKTQAGSLTEALRRKERLEEMRPYLLAHPYTGVRHRQHQVRSRQCARMSPGGVRADRLAVSLDEQAPAVGHGVAGVEGQIHEQLLDLTGVRLHRARPVVQRGLDLYVIAQEPLEHLERVGDLGIQIEAHRGNDLPAGKSQELACQRGRPLPCGRHLLQVEPGRVVARQLGREVDLAHLHVAQDRREQVVEVVSDAARQPPDALHLLGLEKLFVEGATFRDVLDDTVIGDRRSVAAGSHDRSVADPPYGAVAADDAVLDGLRGLAGEDPPYLLLHGFAIVVDDQAHPQFAIARQLLGRVARDPDAAGPVADFDYAPVLDLHADHVIRDRLHDAVVALVDLQTGVLGQL